MVMTHIPVHPINVARWRCNIHGHIHNSMSPSSYTPAYGLKYFNVSCEVLDYTPISIEQIKAQLQMWEGRAKQ